MLLGRLLFIVYRIVERILRVRVEALLLYGIAKIFYILSYGFFTKSSVSAFDDKRQLWGAHRFERLGCESEFREALKGCLSHGHRNFENSMEGSIRGLNLLRSSIANSPRVRIFLHLIYLTNILCPDLFIKREGLRLKDQSNNHQFYVLWFNFLFLKHFYGIGSPGRVLEFVESRITRGMLNEGSSFYHLGVLACIRGATFDGVLSEDDLCHYSKVMKACATFDGQYKALSDINFGDRDGTLIVDPVSWQQRETVAEFEMESIFVSPKANGWTIYINAIISDGFGSGGHYHDDFGHVVLKFRENSVVHDIGIFQYSEEPLYCRREYHNLPYFVETPGMLYEARFVRKPRHKTCVLHRQGCTIFENRFENKIIRRYFFHKSRRIVDLAIGEGAVRCRFAVTSQGLIYDGESYKMGKDRRVLSQYAKPTVGTSKGNIFPDYGVKLTCQYIDLEWTLAGEKRVQRLQRIGAHV